MQPQRAQKIRKGRKAMKNELIDQLSNKIIGLAIKVHKALGPGFVEKVYERALEEELKKEKIEFKTQEEIKIKYGNIYIGGQRLDFLIEDEVILELKSVSEINEIHKAQMISYLKAANKRLGLILNFAKKRLEIKRIVNNF